MSKMKALSITLDDESLVVLERISKLIGTLTYSAAIRYLIRRYSVEAGGGVGGV